MIKTITTVESVSRLAGGMYDGVRRLTQELATLEVSSDVFSLKDNRTADDIDSWAEQRPDVFDASGPGRYCPALSEKLSACIDKDLAHDHGLWTFNGMAVHRWARVTNKPYIVSTHGMLNPDALKCSRLKKLIVGAAFESKYLAGAACIRAVSEAEAGHIRDYGLKGPVCLIPNGVDIPGESSGKKEKTILYLGRMHPGKNLENLIAAWSTTDKQDWKLKIAGWGDAGYESKLKSAASSCEGLEFEGPLFGDEKDNAYQAASVFVLPSRYEGSPLSVLEAWAQGVPVVMTPECGFAEGFAAGAAVEIGTEVDSIAEGLKSIISLTAEQRSEMGEKGKQLVRSSYSWADAARKMKLVYEWMLGKADKPGFVV